MRLNWIGYQFREYDGYGRFGNRMIQALRRLGVEVQPLLTEVAYSPEWIQRDMGANWDDLTISCVPPYFNKQIPGRNWLFSMTEGSELPEGWGDIIKQTHIERVIVPCQYNFDGFSRGIANVHYPIPVHIVPGGTDPGEFYPITERPDETGPYTFMAIGDRGGRKGWVETYQAFYDEFGPPWQTEDVALVIKVRPASNEMLDRMHAIMIDPENKTPDPRVSIWIEDVSDMIDVYSKADCLVIPSRSEGWGMPQREAAMMGIPVITQRYAGIDDGYADVWSMPVENGTIEPIPPDAESIAGMWKRPDTDEIGRCMEYCFNNPKAAKDKALLGAEWLIDNQTWDHSAQKLIELIERWH